MIIVNNRLVINPELLALIASDALNDNPELPLRVLTSRFSSSLHPVRHPGGQGRGPLSTNPETRQVMCKQISIQTDLNPFFKGYPTCYSGRAYQR